MAVNEREFVYVVSDNFLGGVNSYAPPNKLQAPFVVDAQNCMVNEVGVLTRRSGLTTLGTLDISSADSAYNIFAAGEGDQHKVYVAVGVDSTEVLYPFAWDGTSWRTTIGSTFGKEEVSFTWSTEGSISAADSVEKIVMCGAGSSQWTIMSKITIVDSATDPTMGLSTTAPQNMRYLATAAQRLWAAGSKGNTNVRRTNRAIVYWSAAYPNQITWDTETGFMPIFTGRGEQITGLAPFQSNMMFIGMTSSTQLLIIGSGNIAADSQTLTLSNDIGCGSNKTIAHVGEDLLFMDQHGNIRSVSAVQNERQGGIRPLPISAAIKDQTDLIDTQKLHHACAAFHNGKYWFSFLKTDGTRKLYSWDSTLRSWTGPHTFKNNGGTELKVIAMTVGYGTPGGSELDDRGSHLYFLTDDGSSLGLEFQVFEYDSAVTKDHANALGAITMSMTTKADDYNFLAQDKQLQWCEVEYGKTTGTTAQFSVEARVDFQEWHMLGKVNYNDPQLEELNFRRFSMRDIAKGRHFQFRIKSAVVDAPPEIFRITVAGTLNDISSS